MTKQFHCITSVAGQQREVILGMGRRFKTLQGEQSEALEVTDGHFIFQETLQFKTEKNGRKLPTILGIYISNLSHQSAIRLIDI